VDFVFIFVDKLLSQSGAILLFHSDDLWILKQIKEFMDSYSMLSQMKWAIVNSLSSCSTEDLGLKVHLLSHIFSLLLLLLVSTIIFNALFSSCKHYSTKQHFWWGPPKLLSFKHLFLAYLSRGLGLRKKMFCTIGPIAPQWQFQILGSHFVWAKKCIL
jgi:hypothetical protein